MSVNSAEVPELKMFKRFCVPIFIVVVAGLLLRGEFEL
jgi:hypothetical protein